MSLNFGRFDHGARVWGAATNGTVLLLARIMMGAIFINSGFGKLGNISGFASSLVRRGISDALAWPLSLLAGCTEFFCGLAVVIGFQFEIATLLLVLFTIVATLISHRFWELAPPDRGMQFVQFQKNLAMIGGFLALLMAGPGRFSLRRRRQ